MIPKCAFFVATKLNIIALYFLTNKYVSSESWIFLKDNSTVGDMIHITSHSELEVSWFEVPSVKLHHSWRQIIYIID